jgi:hypothetical protein
MFNKKPGLLVAIDGKNIELVELERNGAEQTQPAQRLKSPSPAFSFALPALAAFSLMRSSGQLYLALYLVPYLVLSGAAPSTLPSIRSTR